MRADLTLLLLCAGVLAAVIQQRDPQYAPTVVPAPRGKGSRTGLGSLFSSFGPLIGEFVSQPGNLAGLAASLIPATKFAGKTVLEPRYRKEAKRHVARYGPISIVGKGQSKPKEIASVDPNGQAFVNLVQDGLCSECTILAGQTELVFEDGSHAGPDQNVYIHHILSVDISKQGIIPVYPCDAENWDPDRIPNSKSLVADFISQREHNRDQPVLFTTTDGNYNSGFHVKGKDTFFVTSDLVYYSNQTRNVYLKFDIEYLDGIHGQDAAPALLSLAGCKATSLKTNETRTITTDSRKFPILVDGTVISAQGYIHNGGEKMILYHNGKEICVSIPTYEDNKIVGMSHCDLRQKVKRQDTLTIETVYDLEKHPLSKEVSGGYTHDIMGGMDVMDMYTMSIAFD